MRRVLHDVGRYLTRESRERMAWKAQSSEILQFSVKVAMSGDEMTLIKFPWPVCPRTRRLAARMRQRRPPLGAYRSRDGSYQLFSGPQTLLAGAVHLPLPLA